jgi:hypothetical protein
MPASITCPRCGWTSHNPHDIAEQYCGHCHVFLNDEAEFVNAMTTELLGKADRPMEIVFHPLTVFQLTGLVQLALRHPRVSPELQETARRFLAGVREYFADCPAVLDVVRRGDDPGEDR